MKIKHLSINSQQPERAAHILAELTAGYAQPFPSKTMDGAWLCQWQQDNELVEFIPANYKIVYGKESAIYEPQACSQNFHASHFMLETERPLSELVAIAQAHGLVHRFRRYYGGPLYEIWLDENILVEFCSIEISLQ